MTSRLYPINTQYKIKAEKFVDYFVNFKLKIRTNHNTDGIINGLVMVFAKPCSHDRSCQNLHPDTRAYSQ